MYNTEHRHSAIREYLRARARHPERWSRDTRDWTPAGPVRLNPSPEVKELKRIG
ncbi:hypothetical protein HPP05_38515 [Corallococcus exiguus]|nr:hypothetical protein [Corallococcus exiguus]NPD22065.1 hypothetical protein [Corallococcus exiguus]NRD45206.1 hypothetical protein [Corallococcus exiguus]